jgi:hypothetical protein
MPSMLRSGFVMVEAEFFLSHLEAVLDRPAMAFNLHERVDPGPGRAPDREERQFAVRECVVVGSASRGSKPLGVLHYNR